MHWLFQPELLPEVDGLAAVARPSPRKAGRLFGLSTTVWRGGGIILVTTALVLFLALLYDLPFLKYNLTKAGEFFSSAYFALFCCVAVVLSVQKISGFWYEISAFVLAVFYLFILYGENLQFFHMTGDNICQVAYWNILFHPDLAGGIGVASAKPGQILLLGLLHQLSLLGGQIVFQVGICLIMAALVWSLVAVATELGGRVAGILAFILSVWAFAPDFLYGESTIYVVTPVFAGLRLYYYHPRWKSLGRLLLVLSILFRIEVIAVLAAVWLIHLARREWRDLSLLSAWALLSLVTWAGIILKIQGSFARINSGAAAGYLGPLLDNGQINVQYIIDKVAGDYANFYCIRFLFILVIAGIAGAFTFERKRYLSVFASLVVIMANVFFFGGIIELTRYIPLVYAFACSIGIASLVRYGYLVWWRERYLGLTGVLAVTVVLVAGFDFSRLNAYLGHNSNEIFVNDAREILADNKLPVGVRLMSEDDILSYVVVLSPKRFSAVTSLQHFNIVSEEKRQEILSRTDFIWINLNGYPFYYLSYLPLSEWRLDPFRKMALTFLEYPAQPRSLYGFRFTRIGASPSHVLLKVEG